MRKVNGVTGLLSCPRCEGDHILTNQFHCPQRGFVGAVYCDDCHIGVVRDSWEGGLACARRVWQSSIMEEYSNDETQDQI